MSNAPYCLKYRYLGNAASIYFGNAAYTGYNILDPIHFNILHHVLMSVYAYVYKIRILVD